MKLTSNFTICIRAVYWVKCHFLSLPFLLKAEKISCSKNVVKGSGEPVRRGWGSWAHPGWRSNGFLALGEKVPLVSTRRPSQQQSQAVPCGGECGDVRQCWNKELSLEARKTCLTLRAHKQGNKVKQNAQRSCAVFRHRGPQGRSG